MTRLRYDGLETTLGAALTSGASTAATFAGALTYDGGTAVPTISGSDYIPFTILDTDGNLSEIVYLTAYTEGDPDGTISRGEEGTAGIAHATGLALVHAPTVADIENSTDIWHYVGGSGEPAFANGWTNFATSESGTDRSFVKFTKMNDGMVLLKGSGKAGTVGMKMFTLPAGYRPDAASDNPAVSYSGAAFFVGNVVIDSTGDVAPVGALDNLLVSLDGIRFRVT